MCHYQGSLRPSIDEEDEDGDGDVDQDDEVIDAENDLNGEETDGEDTLGDAFDDGDDDGPVSANAEDGQAEASTPGATARAEGDPDELAPETSVPDNVIDDIVTEGPLPNTAGSLWVYVMPGLGCLLLLAVLVKRMRGSV